MKRSMIFLVIFAASNAFALHSLNCSNADTSLRRVEKEIWGANPINYFYHGQDIGNESTLDVKFSKKRGIRFVKTKDSSTEIYSAKLSITNKDGSKISVVTPEGLKVETEEAKDFVICQNYQDSSID